MQPRSRSGRRGLAPASILALLAAAPAAHAEGFGPARLWHGFFAPGAEVPLTGDVTGDGRDDLISFVRSSQTDTRQGDVWVAASNGAAFGASVKWHDWFGVGAEVPLVGDFDGDGDDDIVTFIRSSQGGTAQGDVYVALSNRTSFGPGQKWHDWFCVGAEVPAVGDVNGDGRDDLIAFVRNSQTGAAQGDVWVALSTGTGFGAGQKWHDGFASGGELPFVGDVDGDGDVDLIGFARDAYGDGRRGDVTISLSSRTSFGPVTVGHDFFGIGAQEPRVGDFNGDRRADIAVFVRDTAAAPGQGDVYVAFSDGLRFGATRLWHPQLALGNEVPAVGDVNGDFKDDAVVFLQDTQPEPRRADVLAAITGDPVAPEPSSRATAFGYRGTTIYGAEARGTRPLLTILLAFSDRDIALDRRSAYWTSRLFTSATGNLNGWFQENSGGLFAWSNAGVRGPYLVPDDLTTIPDERRFACSLGRPARAAPAPECVGTSSNEEVVRRRAIERAYQDGFPFASYDTNRDGRVTANELQVLIVNGGGHVANRNADVECFSPGYNATVQVCPGAIAGVDQHQDLATTIHEVAHSLGTIDVYGGLCHSNRLSLQGCTWGDEFWHLDPWNKIQLGWIEPRIYDLAQSGACALINSAQFGNGRYGDRRPVLLYDARRASGEYFLVEYRAADGTGTYDRDTAGNGVAVWQVRSSGRQGGFGLDGANLASLPSTVIIDGGNDGLQTRPASGTDDWLDIGRIHPGPDRVLQTVPFGNDVIPPEVHDFTFGAPDGRRGGDTLWTSAHGVFALRYADRTWTEARLEVGPTSLTGQIAVKWTMHSFDAALAPGFIADPTLRTCYERVP